MNEMQKHIQTNRDLFYPSTYCILSYCELELKGNFVIARARGIYEAEVLNNYRSKTEQVFRKILGNKKIVFNIFVGDYELLRLFPHQEMKTQKELEKEAEEEKKKVAKNLAKKKAKKAETRQEEAV